MSGKLVLRNDGGGPRHYLDGKPVSCGTVLKLFVGDRPALNDHWRWARYEANLHPNRISVTLDTSFGIVLPNEDTVLRWPKENE